MSKGIILYRSKYGATERYAKWLRDATGYDLVETIEARVSELREYDVIVLGGGLYGTGIAGAGFLKKNMNVLYDKKIAVFAVGASPDDEESVEKIKKMSMKGALSDIPMFYCRGSWDEDRMQFLDRTMCRMLERSVEKQDPAGYNSWQKSLMDFKGKKCDWTDKAYLKPLIEYISS